jgi:hypothetical protein
LGYVGHVVTNVGGVYEAATNQKGTIYDIVPKKDDGCKANAFARVVGKCEHFKILIMQDTQNARNLQPDI